MLKIAAEKIIISLDIGHFSLFDRRKRYLIKWTLLE